METIESLKPRIKNIIDRELEIYDNVISEKQAWYILLDISERNLQDAIMDDMQGYERTYSNRISIIKDHLKTL